MRRATRLAVVLALIIAFCPLEGYAMERAAMDQLLSLARSRPDSPEFRAVLVKHLPEAEIKQGIAFNSNGSDFIWAVETSKTPSMVIDDQPVTAKMLRIAGTDVWFHTQQLRVGTSHRFHYVIDGAKFGGSFDMPAYTPDSYARPGAPQGKIQKRSSTPASCTQGWKPTTGSMCLRNTTRLCRPR